VSKLRTLIATVVTSLVALSGLVTPAVAHRSTPKQSCVNDAGTGRNHDGSAGRVEVVGLRQAGKWSLDVDHLVVVIVEPCCGSGTRLGT
jgi:hypothetical protein